MKKTNILFLFILCFSTVNIFTQTIKLKSGHTGTVSDVVFSPDGKQIVSGSYDEKTIKIWDVSTGKEIKSFFTNKFGVDELKIYPDGKRLIYNLGNLPGIIIICDKDTGKELRIISDFANRPILSMDLSPDGRQIAVIYDEYYEDEDDISRICFFDANTGKLNRCFFSNSAGIIAFSPDGKRIVNGLPGKIKIWDPVTGKEILTISEDIDSVNFIKFTPDGKYIISNVYSKQESGPYLPYINIYDANTGKKKTIISTKPEQYGPIAISPDGNLIAFVPYDKKIISLFDISADKEIKTISNFSGHTHEITCLVFSPDGKMIVSGSADKSIKLWDVATGKEIRTMGE